MVRKFSVIPHSVMYLHTVKIYFALDTVININRSLNVTCEEAYMTLDVCMSYYLLRKSLQLHITGWARKGYDRFVKLFET